MEAKSVRLKIAPPSSRPKPRTRLRYPERRRQILEKAAEFFAEYGLTGQTRSLAQACGVSQRLLYRFFPTKAALLDAVYESAILGSFKGVWFAQLTDRSRGVEARLNLFYRDYLAAVLTRQWMRLFIYASLAESSMAPKYISSTIKLLLETIVAEVAHEQEIALPDDKPLLHEVGWTLHGAISHLAIRKHLYHASQSVPEEMIIATHVRAFLAGFPAMVAGLEALPSRAACAPAA
jgi:AcrR family transcriptional regulator